ncbi:inositol monophosphatase family protein [Bosea sp. (in: a-proteobacteria)]|uniref:inositol monophosphatase family protein n=1 Tax=Bosea sp. (in: a-proteobacteria) TaxID=1871050 RepID=UPI0026116F33|nr:inositol monophosphatase family protein [Bosea sp. (in: a-proteobacteria)]MCO5089712.1 inositol monophosphatase family protein [Bosea sp. (in: a-proteobacteria)]
METHNFEHLPHAQIDTYRSLCNRQHIIGHIAHFRTPLRRTADGREARGKPMTPDVPVEASHVAFATELANTSRRMIEQNRRDRLGVSLKPDRSLVTMMDMAIERELRAMIKSRFPEHGIIGEEQAWENEDAEFVWILDPIDGTASFIAGMPVYGTLIALAHRGVPVLGIIDIPPVDARWLGVSGQPTLKNGAPCRVKPCPDLSLAMMSTSNPDFYSKAERPALDLLRARTNWRIYGGAALAYGLLSDGGTDVALDTGLKIYDFAPFRPIIEGAGGVITDWRGNPITLKSGPRILAAGDRQKHSEIVGLLNGLDIGA